MAATGRLKLRDGDRLIDAEFSVTMSDPGSFTITFESSGGGPKRDSWRNTEYREGLAELLRRAVPIAASLDDCLLVSGATRHLTEQERRVKPNSPYELPLALTGSENFEELRLALTSPLSNIGSKATKGGGNTRKKIALRFTTREPQISVDQVIAALDAAPSDKLRRDRKDIAEGLSNADIDAARSEWILLGPMQFHQKYGTSRAAKFVIADPDGTEYDAKAILFAARQIAGLDGANSDFDGDRKTVAEPLENLGYVVEDITNQDDDLPSTANPDEARDRAIQQAKAFAGQTDATTERKVRREQRLLRKALGLDGSSHACALCGRTYPDRLLVAAHIKKRSECSPEEKVDIPAVAMIACTLGCDALFEHGYVVVTDQGVIEATKKGAASPHVTELVERLVGRKVSGHSESAAYYAWHRAKA